MSALSLESFPAVDPWWDLYMPAVFGEADAVLDALDAAEAFTPLAERGDLYAVAARAFAVLGRYVESERLAEQAFRLGGPEADALATFVAPDGPARAERRTVGGRAGARADAWCDLAALRLQAGDVPGARAAVERALAICSGHAEAGRWTRFFEDAADPTAAVRDALDPRRARRRTLPARDAAELLPTRRTGWLSTERYQRRLLATPPESAWAPSGTALGRLQDAGVGGYFFALDGEYARAPADHPLVATELAADALRSRVDEGRDAVWDAAAFWEAVGALDLDAQADGAQLLAGLGTLDARLARTSLTAVAWLAANRPAQAALWEGYRVWLAHLVGAGADAVAGARALVAQRPIDALTWRMAIETLRAERCDDVDRIVRAARAEPTLAGMACELARGAPRPFRMLVSPRITPRWPTPPAER